MTTAAPARTNLTITEPDGTTTKINEPGATLDAAAVRALTDAVLEAADGAAWVVMSGSLPPGLPTSWYADVVALLASAALPCRRRHLRCPARGAGRRRWTAELPT